MTPKDAVRRDWADRVAAASDPMPALVPMPRIRKATVRAALPPIRWCRSSQSSQVQQIMSEAAYEAYKAQCLATIKAAQPDARGYIQIAEDEENRDWQTRAMKELNEEGEFKECRAYILGGQDVTSGQRTRGAERRLRELLSDPEPLIHTQHDLAAAIYGCGTRARDRCDRSDSH
jgi:hypothetical protein